MSHPGLEGGWGRDPNLMPIVVSELCAYAMHEARDRAADLMHPKVASYTLGRLNRLFSVVLSASVLR